MALLIAFSLFVVAIVICTIFGISTVIPMVFGFFVFFFMALRKGCSVKDVLKAAWQGVRSSPKILTILFSVGILTATWRMGGVIAFFVYYGIQLITPSLFILLAFLLTTLVAYALGSTVAVISTIGLILMTIARSGGTNLCWVAGAILSGSLLAERVSPTSSCQNLISGLCGVELYGHLRKLQKNALVPFFLCLAVYTLVSFACPLKAIDTGILASTAADFSISFWALAPMAIMLILPLFKVDVRWAILLSALAAGILAVTIQGYSLSQVLSSAIFGYVATDATLGTIWDGGGVLSMLSIMAVFVLAYIYSKIFEAAHMLGSFYRLVDRAWGKLGQTGTLLIISVVFSAIFCSGTTASILAILILLDPYEKRGHSRQELAQDMGILLICITPMVPWCVVNTMAYSLFQVPNTTIFYVVGPFLSSVYYLGCKWYAGRKTRRPGQAAAPKEGQTKKRRLIL